MHILSSSSRPEIRQMAAVELRKRSVKLWANLDKQSQEQVKNGLLDLALRDSEYFLTIFSVAHYSIVLESASEML